MVDELDKNEYIPVISKPDTISAMSGVAKDTCDSTESSSYPYKYVTVYWKASYGTV
jgi:hypothetical protein